MNRLKQFVMTFITVTAISASAQAFTVHDPINGAYNLLRNTLMELHQVENLRNALERLTELKKTFNELERFHSGIDEIRQVITGDYKRLLYRFNSGGLSSLGYELNRAQRDLYELVNGGFNASQNYRSHLNSVFGEDPNSATKPYITQEEVFVADGLRWSGEVKKIVETTFDAGDDISRAAQTASPKGAARLSADALGKILVAQAQIQQNQSKQIELSALQVEQNTREEKYYERERLKFMREFNQLLDALPSR